MKLNDAWMRVLELARSAATSRADQDAIATVVEYDPNRFRELLRLVGLHAAYYNAGHPDADGDVVGELHAEADRCGLDFDRLAAKAAAIVDGYGNQAASIKHPREQIKGFDEDDLARVAERLDKAAEDAMPGAEDADSEDAAAAAGYHLWDRIGPGQWYLPLTDEDESRLEAHITRERREDGRYEFWLTEMRDGMPQSGADPYDDLAAAMDAGGLLLAEHEETVSQKP